MLSTPRIVTLRVVAVMALVTAVVATVVTLGACQGERSSATVPAHVPDSAATTEPDARPQPETFSEAPRTHGDDVKQPPVERIVRPMTGITVYPDAQRVELDAVVCLDAGWLEQIACAPHSREHESLVVLTIRPSHIHAALLLAGFLPGKPGSWSFENDEWKPVPPQGEELAVSVRYRNESGTVVEERIGAWIADLSGNGLVFPDKPWVFGGSLMRANPQGMGPGEHYVADHSGSIIGLVTFGDELLGFSEVIADQVAVHEPVWGLNVGAVPPVGTKVTLILKRFE